MSYSYCNYLSNMISFIIPVVCLLGGTWIMNYPVVNLNGTGANIR